VRTLHHDNSPAMSAPPLELPPSSHSTSGHHDGLGRRTLSFDREDGLILERLQLRPELRAFEAALRERIESAGRFEDERFARVRSIEHDPGGSLTVVSEFVAGNRVCDLLEAASGLAAEEATSLSVDAALGFLLEILPALGTLHTVAGFTHGAVGPDRTVLTPTGEVVLLDSVFGHTLERLHFDRRRLWHELRIAAPPAAGPARFDVAADLGQASLTALMIVIGRLLKDTEYPDGLSALVTEVVEIAQIRGSAKFAAGLHHFLLRTLPLPGRKAYANADEAAIELRQLAREIGIDRCGTALIAFIEDMNRNLAAIEPSDAADRAVLEFDSDFDLDAEPIVESELDLFDEVILPIAPDETPDAFVLKLAPEDFVEMEPSAAAVEFAAAEELAAGEEAAPAASLEYETIEVFVAMEPEAPETIAAEAEAAAAYTFESEEVVEPALPIDSFAIEPEAVAAPVLAAEPELAPDKEITLIRERFALAAKQVAEPTIAFDESFPDPSIQPASAGELHTLQQETAAWRAAFVALDEASEPARAAAAAVPVPEPVVSARKLKRGAKADRDKLRSNAPIRSAPVPVPQPVAPMPVTMAPPPVHIPAPLFVQPAMPTYGQSTEAAYNRNSEPIRPNISIQARPAAVPAPIAPVAAPSIGLRVKADFPTGYKPPSTRPERHNPESGEMAAPSYVPRGAAKGTSSFPWKPAAAAVVVIAVAGAGFAYWPKGAGKPAAAVTSRSTKAAPEAAAAILTGSSATGTIVVETQPTGATVHLDGKLAGESPVTLNGVSAGRHTLTFISAAGTVKKTVRVEAGKVLSLDVPVAHGWVAVFAPIPLDISENGRAIGSTEQGPLILSPGRHVLTFSNRELGYSVVQTVEIEPAEERTVNVVPMGQLNVNADPFAEVWLDGKKIGDTPLGGHPVPLGTHEVVFKNPEFGERRVTTVITASPPVSLSVDFRKPPGN
jgi:hypothetical protein